MTGRCAATRLVRGEGRTLEGDEVKARLEQMMSQVRRMATDMTATQKKMLRVTATVSSADGNVTATVGPRGHLVDLKIDPKIYRKPNSGLLAQTIVQTVQQAVEQVLNESQDLVESAIPEEFRFDGYAEGWGMPKGGLRKHDAVILKTLEDEDDE